MTLKSSPVFSIYRSGSLPNTSTQPELEMEASSKDLLVSSSKCASEECSKPDSCSNSWCWLCKKCLASEELAYLRMGLLEHANRHQARRVYPKPMSLEEAKAIESSRQPPEQGMSASNHKMLQWFAGKCVIDRRFCY